MDLPVPLFRAQPVGGSQHQDRVAARAQRLHHPLAMRVISPRVVRRIQIGQRQNLHNTPHVSQTNLLVILALQFIFIRMIKLDFALPYDFIENLRQITLSLRLSESFLQNRNVDDFLNAAHVTFDDFLDSKLLLSFRL